MQSLLLPIIIALPLLGAATIAGLGRRWSRPTIAAVACSAVLLAFGATAAALAQYLSAGDLSFVLSRWQVGGIEGRIGLLGDSVSLWFMVVVTGVGFLIHMFSAGYMAHDVDYGRYFAKLNYFIFAMSLLILADNFMALMMGWANVGLASYLLIGFYRDRPAANDAQVKAFFTNMIGEIFMFAGVGAVVMHYGSLVYGEVFDAVAAKPAAATLPALLLLVGAVAKSAQLPLHVWLPDAMQGPTPVSALIHAATMVTAGVYLVARAYPLYQASATAMTAVAVVGALGALVGALIATRQNDIKKVLAFSTMSQIGFMFLGNGVGAHSAALFHFMTHAFFKAGLFLTAGIIIHELGGEQDIRRMGGLRHKMPFAYAAFGIGVLALIGIPPFAGFFSKDEILGAAFAGGHYGVWFIGLVAAGLTAFYNTRLFALVFLGEPFDAGAAFKSKKRKARPAEAAVSVSATTADGYGAHAGHDAHHTGPSMKVPVAILSVLAVVGGLMGIPHVWNLPHYFMEHYFERWHGLIAHEGPLTLIPIVLAVAAIGIVAAWRLYGPAGTQRLAEQRGTGEPAGLLGKGFYFDDLYDAVVVQAGYATSRWAAGVDAGGIDGLVNRAGAFARWLSHRWDWLHSGLLRRYALTVVAGLVLTVAYYLFI